MKTIEEKIKRAIVTNKLKSPKIRRKKLVWLFHSHN